MILFQSFSSVKKIVLKKLIKNNTVQRIEMWSKHHDQYLITFRSKLDGKIFTRDTEEIDSITNYLY